MVTLELERKAMERGAGIVIGVDEVGRGCWCGVLTCAAVAVVDLTPMPDGLDDSKKLSDKRRREMVPHLEHWVAAHAVCDIEPDHIDRVGMARALRDGFQQAVRSALKDAWSKGIAPRAGHGVHVLVDGPVDFLSDMDDHCGTTETVVRGDQHSAAIAAASVLAKVHRDSLMVHLDEVHPGYGLAGHKGYPTPAHRRAVETLGLSEIHRRSWQVTGS